MREVYSFEFAKFRSYPEELNLVRHDDYLQLAPGVDEGEILCHPINSLLGYTYDAFELCPSEEGITVAIKQPHGEYAQFDGDRWTIAEYPVYYSPERLREILPLWTGSLQVRLRLVRSYGKRPRLQCMKLGFFVPGHLESYLLSFALPKFFTRDIPLSRFVNLSPDGRTLLIPPRLIPERISNLHIYPSTGGSPPVPCRIEGDRIVPEVPMPRHTCCLLFNYRVPAQEINSDMEQLEDVPIVLVRGLERRNTKLMSGVDQVVRMAGDRDLIRRQYACHHLEVEVHIITHQGEKNDGRAILDTLIGACCREGRVDAPPQNKTIPIHIIGQPAAGSLRVIGDTQTQTFKISVGPFESGVYEEIVSRDSAILVSEHLLG